MNPDLARRILEKLNELSNRSIEEFRTILLENLSVTDKSYAPLTLEYITSDKFILNIIEKWKIVRNYFKNEHKDILYIKRNIDSVSWKIGDLVKWKFHDGSIRCGKILYISTNEPLLDYCYVFMDRQNEIKPEIFKIKYEQLMRL